MKKVDHSVNPLKGEFEVEVNGKVVRGLSSVNALRLLCRDHKISLSQLDDLLKEDEITAFCSIVYYSCINHAVRHNETLGFSKEAFISFLLDDMNQLNEVIQVISRTLNPQEVNQEGEVDSEKK
jgi:hypothetical protein